MRRTGLRGGLISRILSSGNGSLRGYGTSEEVPDELVQRGVRLALESERPIAQIATDLGMHPETLRKKVRQHEVDAGLKPGMSTSEREEIRALKRENFELRRANEILKAASVFFAKELDVDRTR